MSAWVVVPCLLTLRDEFNRVSPNRDKGADGTIGDSSHTSSSDHSPDEDSDILRDHDADSKNEVHALDTDSSGPWPGGWAWFDAKVLEIVERHRLGVDDRLQYVIWNGHIYSRSTGWAKRVYSGQDPHTNHAHFSARYTTAQEQDTSPWGVFDGSDDMALTDDLIEITESTAKRIGKKTGEKVSAATLLQLAVIYGKDADDSGEVASLADQVGALSGRLTAIETALSVLAAKVNQPTGVGNPGPAPTAAEIADELAQRLQA